MVNILCCDLASAGLSTDSSQENWTQILKDSSVSYQDELSQSDDLSKSRSTGARRDPFGFDPCFETEEQMQEYLKYIGHKDVLVSNELQVCVPTEVNKRVCDCLNCVDIKIINNQDRVASSLNKVPVTYQLFGWLDWLEHS